MATSLRIGVLSTADIARTKVIPGMRKAERCEVSAIASRDAARAQEVATEMMIPRAHGSYEALLADTEVDAVYIPLPNHLHDVWTVAAARAGKHVLCEKPLSVSSERARGMIDACRDAGVVLMEAFMYRLHPSWAAVREMVEAGRIGRLVAVQSWFSYFNDDPGNIRNIREVGGGALYDIGCYCVNLSRTLFGDEPTRVEGSITRDPVGGTDTLASALMEFGEGVATFTASTRAEDDQRVHIHGSEGRISIGIPFNIPPDRPTEVFVTSGGNPPTEPDTEVLTFPVADPYAVETERFVEMVLDGAPPPFPPEDAVANLEVMERIVASAEQRDQVRAVPSK